MTPWFSSALRSLLLSAAVLGTACGDDPSGEGLAPGGKDGDSDEVDAGEPLDPNIPVVSVLSPSPVSDPSSEAVITGDSVDIVCEVRESQIGVPIDHASVSVNVYVGQQIAQTQTTTTAEDNKYTAKISVRDLPTGPIGIECTASDTSEQPNSGFARIDTLVDHGPTITFTTPSDGSPVGTKSDVPVIFTLSPTPLGDTDPGAAVDYDSLEMRINGFLVNPEPAEDAPAGTFTYTIDFQDRAVFPSEDLTSAELEVAVRNKRSPEPALATSSLSLLVDGVAPIIENMVPADRSIVGGQVVVSAKITDTISGVDVDTARLEIEVGGETDVLYLSKGAADTFVTDFQAAKYAGRSQLTLNFVAVDRAGNEQRQSVLVDLDTVPPWVSLDPPNVREYFPESDGSCTISFDPVGEQAVNDLQVISSSSAVHSDRYRALVWERGVQSPGDSVVKLSMVDETSVAIYIQGDPAVPLITDIDDDAGNTCDSINTEPAITIELTSLKPTGSQLKQTAGGGFEDSPVLASCVLSDNAGPEDTLCDGESEMRRVIAHDDDEKISVIYVPSPAKNATDPYCTGEMWESTVAGGWTCAVAVARDKAGNLGISRPLRLCYALNGAAGCPGSPPSCTDGCVMPDIYTEDDMRVILAR